MPTNAASDFEHFTNPTATERRDAPADDEITEPTAFRLGIVGVGQCGGNIATKFFETGYRSVLLINTAQTDLDSIEYPVAKLALDKHGAGKNRDSAQECAERKKTEIRTKMESIFRNQVNKIVVCMALGGGTGSGAGPKVIEIAKEMIRENGGNPEKDVIAIMVLPEPRIDGPRQSFNALKAYAEVDRMNVVRVVVDNAKIANVVKSRFEDQLDWTNHWVVRTFHRFNNYAAEDSRFGNFDGTDLDDVLSRGRVIFSAFTIADLEDRFDVGSVMAEHLAGSMFAGSDLKTAEAAACVMILNRSKMSDKSQNDISNAFEVLNGIMRPNSTLHRGIYLDDFPAKPDGGSPDAMLCYVMLGGLDHPYESLKPIFAKAHGYAPEYGTLSAFWEP